MDNNYWGPPQVGEPAVDGGAGDWRSQLQPDLRQMIVNKIMDTLKRHLPFSGQEGLQELNKIAVRFEEKIYSAATSQSDYLRKISGKMLTMETESQNAGQSNPAGNSNRPPDPASLDTTAQTGHATGGDWQEEVYQNIKVMKEMYLPELCEMYLKIATKLQQLDTFPQQPELDQLEKLKMFKTMLERLISVLQIPKHSIEPSLKETLVLYEKEIVNFINTNRPRKQVPSMQQGQLPPPHMQSMQQVLPQEQQKHHGESSMMPTEGQQSQPPSSPRQLLSQSSQPLPTQMQTLSLEKQLDQSQTDLPETFSSSSMIWQLPK